MRDCCELGRIGFGNTDTQLFVTLTTIRGKDGRFMLERQLNGKIGFAHCRWTGYNNAGFLFHDFGLMQSPHWFYK